jgi:transketolase
VRDAFIKRLEILAERDPRVMLVTGDLGFGVLTGFAERRPGQYLNAGVAEQNMTGVAVGLALEGRIVFTYSIANFPTLRCLEQIRSDAAYHDANVKVVAIGGGFSYGSLGMSHHATEDLAILRAMPQLTVVAPGDRWEAAEATEAVLNTPGTCYLRLDKSFGEETHGANERFVLGRGRTLVEGERVAILTCGGILGAVQRAVSLVAPQNLRPTVVSMHTVKPIDRDLILRLARTHDAILTVEEHVLNGGLGGAVSEVLVDAGVMPKRMRRLGLGDRFRVEVGTQEFLRSRTGLGAEDIAAAIRELVA